MTREEAITILSNYDLGFYDINGHPIPQLKLAEACDMAIDALSAQADCDTISGRPHDMPKSADCISRADAIDELMVWEEGHFWDEECLKRRGEPCWVAPSDVIEQLSSADAVQVVRCGKCKHWKCNPNTNEYGVCNKVSCDEFEVVMHSDDFCSYGIRKGGDSHD